MSSNKIRIFVAGSDWKWVVSFSRDLPLSDLKAEIQSRLQTNFKNVTLTSLRLNSLDGPELQDQEVLGDVLREDEYVYVTYKESGAVVKEVGVSGALSVEDSGGLRSSLSQFECQLTIHCVDGKIFQVSCPLAMPINQLRKLITEKWGMDPEQHVIDLFYSNHPIFISQAEANSPLEKWNLLHDTLYVNARIVGDPKELFSVSPENEAYRFQYSNAWQPSLCKQTLSGMSNFLSSLHIFTHCLSSDKDKYKNFVDNLLVMTKCPPAALAIHYLVKRKKIRNELKAILSNALFVTFKNLITDVEETRLFNVANVGFGAILFNVNNHKNVSIGFEEISLNCAFSYLKIDEPCILRGSDEIYDKQIVIQQLSQKEKSVRFAKYTKRDILPAPHFQKYMLCHPEERYIFIVKRISKIIPKADFVGTPLSKIKSKTIHKIPQLRLIPSLELKHSTFPHLVLTSSENVGVSLGPEPCMVQHYLLLDPITGETRKMDYGKMAKKLSETLPEPIKMKHIQQAMIICFDVSDSMLGDSFKDMKEFEPMVYVNGDTSKLLEGLSNFPWIGKMTNLYNLNEKFKRQVLKEIGSQDPGLKQLLTDHPEAIQKLLSPPAAKHNQKMLIRINLKEDSLFKMNLKPYSTIEKVKSIVNEKFKRDPNCQFQISYNNKFVNDDDTLHSFPLDKSNEFFEIDSLNITVKDLRIEVPKVYHLNVPADLKCCDLGYFIWDKIAAPPHSVSFWHDVQQKGDGVSTGALIDGPLTLKQTFENTEDITLLVHKKKASTSEATSFSRLETMKEMCQLFLNRLEALPFHTSVGLILFGSTVKEICKPTPVLEHLRDEFDSIELNGDTSLFDAIHIATATLQEYCKDHPKIRKRILCITDGLDTSSEVTPWILASVLQSHQIVLDSIILDKGADNPDLTAVSKSSGGFAFAPETVRDAIKILELDTMLSLFERPELKPQKIEEQSDFSVFRNLQPDKCASNNLPLKINPIHSKKSMTLSAAVERFVPDNSLGRRSYLLIQLKQLSGSNHPKFDIFPSYDDLGFWKIIMEGPEGTPYEKGLWIGYLLFPANFPDHGPEVHFYTPIRHCNISRYGKVCHSILTRNWTADTSIHKVLSCVYGLLLEPDMMDAVDTDLAFLFYTQKEKYEAIIRDNVKLNAIKYNRTELGRRLDEQSSQFSKMLRTSSSGFLGLLQ